MGHDVAVCNIANGNLGHVVISSMNCAEIRLKEAQEAAKVIGATHYTIDIGDLYVTAENDDLIRKLAANQKVQPEVVITHYESDYKE